MKTGICIQARMGSTRLPGKVLMSLPEGSHLKALDWTIGACLETGYPVIVATSTNPEDDAIAEFISGDKYRFDAPVDLYRGDPIDVLDRIYQCAKFFQLDEIVRITGDCPFIDPEVILQVIMLRRLKGADYASNVDPATWPDGLDVQVVTFAALDLAWRNATAPTDRDTVLQYIVRNRKDFSVANLQCPVPDMERRRWVLDTAEDYLQCCDIASKLLAVHKYHPRLVDLLALDDGVEVVPGARNERFLAARAAELTAEDFTSSIETAAIARQTQPYGASTYSKSYVAFGEVAPLYVTHAAGSRVFDVDGNEFIDFTGALGTTILGHRDPGIRDAIQAQLDLGIAFPLAHDDERTVARQLIRRIHPGKPIDDYQVVFGKNGSDVTSAAVRLAQVVTERLMIVMHDKGYHGWHDWALAGSHRAAHLFAPMMRIGDNDHIDDGLLEGAAALIVEPDRFKIEDLKGAMEKCRQHGVLTVFDEMVTAFRYPGLTYAQTYGLEPDLICLGKALGNGMPITALVGRKEHMKRFVTGDVKQPYAFYSGTHFGEMLSLAAAGEVLRRMDAAGCWELRAVSDTIHDRVIAAVRDAGLSNAIKVGPSPLSRLTFPFPGWASVFRRIMIRNGCLVYSAFFASLAHSKADMDRLEYALKEAMRELAHPTDEPADMPAAAGIMRS